MATGNPSTNMQKRLTMEDVNLSAPIYDPPKSISVAGLYDPSFVTIEVLNESNPSWTQKFTLPLDLLTVRSAYFKGLFEGGFAESQQGYVKLRNVSPWVFRIFVGWLYCQNIFYNVESKQPRQFVRQPQPASMKIKAVKRKAKETVTSRKVQKRVVGGSAAEQRAEEEDDTSSSELSDYTEDESSESEELQTNPKKPLPKRVKPQPPPSRRHQPGGNKNKYNQTEDIAYGDDTTAAIIFDVIQMKLFELEPRTYLLPHDENTSYAIENLPPTSPLYRLLVDCWGKWLGLEPYGPAVESQVKVYEGLPAHFPSRCLVVAKRSDKALQCPKCRPGGTGAACDAADHTKEDYLMPPRKDFCTYHEHGDDDEEKARCVLRWESRRHLLQ